MASLVWLDSACNCWTVSCISLQSAGSLLLCQEYRRTARKCQRYSPKWLSTLSMIWQIIIDFLKLLTLILKKLNALLSLFLTAYHYSLGVFFPAKGTKAGAIEGCLTWMSLTLSDTECMSSLDIHIYMSAPNLEPSRPGWNPGGAAPEGRWLLRISRVIFLLELLHLDFNQVLWHEETVCPVYLPLFHSQLQYSSHGHLLEEWF